MPSRPAKFTEPIRTRQGFVILKVVQHVPGGVPEFKDVEQQVEENFYMARMEPAMREYLTTMREEAYIDIKPGYVDYRRQRQADQADLQRLYCRPRPRRRRRWSAPASARRRAPSGRSRRKPLAEKTEAPAPAPPKKKAAKGAGATMRQLQ